MPSLWKGCPTETTFERSYVDVSHYVKEDAPTDKEAKEEPVFT